MTMNIEAEGPVFAAEPEPTRLAYTIPEFCTAFAVKRNTLFGLWREQRGPRFLKIGPRTGTILIPVAEAVRWMNRLVEETTRDDWRQHVAVLDTKEAEAALVQAYQRDPSYRTRVKAAQTRQRCAEREAQANGDAA